MQTWKNQCKCPDEESSCDYMRMTIWDFDIMDGVTGCGEETPAPVGTYPNDVSPYGVLDMGGNAQEWVFDWYDPDYYDNSPTENPTGPATGDPDTDSHVKRGWAWNSGIQSYVGTVSFRNFSPEYSTNDSTAFRCARSL